MSKRAGRCELLAILGIAILPFVIAGITFLGFQMDQTPDSTKNQGTLVYPPVQIEFLRSAAKQWSLIQVVKEDCAEVCEQTLYLTRQARIALGKDAARVHRATLSRRELSTTFMDLIQNEHRSLLVLVDAESVERLLKITAEVDNMVFLIDPLGNIMMYFPPDKVGKPLMEDLRHLLRISRIG
ncbi:MAG: hypothetical protein P8J55_14200 [Pseudomonadales bacterium]|nr:hypothetical protein [Pseudomonadales bacterium]